MALPLASATVVTMFEVRIHGRGGQGVVTAAELLSVAAFREGEHSQAFPTFGSERMGAPVTSFCRIDTLPIRLREPIVEPDALIVQDPTLLHQVDVFAGVRDDAYLLLNTGRTLAELGIADFVERLDPTRVRAVPASELARQHLGRPLPNAALLGAFPGPTRGVPAHTPTRSPYPILPGCPRRRRCARGNEAARPRPQPGVQLLAATAALTNDR